MENYLGERIPKLGFGLMRLPKTADGHIDIEQVKEMVDLFLDAGGKYFDTAWGYNDGDSERAAGAALVARYPRESYYLATKLPAWCTDTQEKAEQMLADSLERTGAGYFDFYLLHNLGKGRTEFFDRFGIWDFVQRKKAEGVLKHVGFSMHADAESLDKVLTEHPEMEFVQLQINYADWESAKTQSRLCYEVARKHGKPVIIMEPIKGGALTTLSEETAAPLRALEPETPLSDWALRFAMSLEGLVTVLSGMSSVEQMKGNLALLKSFRPMDEAGYKALEQVVENINAIPTIPCTACGYCMKGCPQNIAIPGAFAAMNSYKVYHNLNTAKMMYFFPTVKEGHAKAGECIGCGQCETVCPQGIAVIEELKQAAAVLD